MDLRLCWRTTLQIHRRSRTAADRNILSPRRLIVIDVGALSPTGHLDAGATSQEVGSKPQNRALDCIYIKSSLAAREDGTADGSIFQTSNAPLPGLVINTSGCKN